MASSSHFHRRTSSTAAYQSLTSPALGAGDVTEDSVLESYSSSRPRPRTGSFAAEQRALEELEEKEGFIPTSVYDIPGQRRSRGRGEKKSWLGWKGKLVLAMVAGGGVGAAVYYTLYYDSGLWWTGAAGASEEIAATASSSTATAAKAAQSVAANYAYSKAVEDVYSTEPTYYSNDEAEAYEEEEDESYSPSTLLASTNSSRSTFDSVTSDNVVKLLENGTLAAYKWHETLPSLNSTGVSTTKTANGGRLIIVGDLHGTHSSLLRLLRRLSFSPSADTLIHTGDILTKSSLNSSLTTISLLRRLGAKGVRGNHDQKVLEWRKWMEAYGPLDRNSISSTSSSSTLGSIKQAVANARPAYGASSNTYDKEEAQSGFRKVSSSHGYNTDKSADAAAKLNSNPHPRREKRGWLDFITGGSNDDTAGAEELLATQDTPLDEEYVSTGEYLGGDGANWADEDGQAEGPSWKELKEMEEQLSSVKLASSASSATSRASKSTKSGASSSEASATTTTTTTRGGRKAFGKPTTLSSHSIASSTRSSYSAAARPSASSSTGRLSSFAVASTSNSSSSSSGALLNTSYSWLTLTAADLSALGIEVPEGWEWGGEHFEVARHLTARDVKYLEELPLTLWVEEVKSWVVHAGMVPWTSLSTTLSKLPSSAYSSSSSSAVPPVLSSTSPLSFTPSTSLSRLLTSHSSLTALLLEPLNTSPFTLLNMRTLTPSSSSSSSSVRGKKAAAWEASSKGRKAGAGSKSWWSVWEEGMKACAGDEEEKCEEAGVIYGHWAGQGLQVQDHSIGLDTGCVYGRRLSALVVPLSSSLSSSYSPLTATSDSTASKASTSASAKNSTVSSASASLKKVAASASASASLRVHKGKQGDVLSSSSASASATATATKSASSANDDEDEEAEEYPSNSPYAEDDEELSSPDNEYDDEYVTATTTATATARPVAAGAKANWHGGIQRLTKSTAAVVPTSSSSSTRSTKTPSSSSTSSSSSSSADSDSIAAAAPTPKSWWNPFRLTKRAPPQGRPGVAPWAGNQAQAQKGVYEAYEAEDGSEEDAEEYEEEEEVVSETSTARRGAKATKSSSSSTRSSKSSTATATMTNGWKKKLLKAVASSSLTRPTASSTGRKPASFATTTTTTSSSSVDADEADDAEEALDVAALFASSTDEDEEEDAEGFEEREVKLVGGKVERRAWVVSVECGGEVEFE